MRNPLMVKRVQLRGGAYSGKDIYLAGMCRDAVYQLPKDATVNDCRRADNCVVIIPLDRSIEENVACSLGTYGCTAGHGDWEIGPAEQVYSAWKHYPPNSLRFRIAQASLAAKENGFR